MSATEAGRRAAARRILSPRLLLQVFLIVIIPIIIIMMMQAPLVCTAGLPILPSRPPPCPQPSQTSQPSTKLHPSSGALTRPGLRQCPRTRSTPSPSPSPSPPSPHTSSNCHLPMQTTPGRCFDSETPRDPILVTILTHAKCLISLTICLIYNLYQVLVNFSSYQVIFHIYSVAPQLRADVRLINI